MVVRRIRPIGIQEKKKPAVSSTRRALFLGLLVDRGSLAEPPRGATSSRALQELHAEALHLGLAAPHALLPRRTLLVEPGARHRAVAVGEAHLPVDGEAAGLTVEAGFLADEASLLYARAVRSPAGRPSAVRTAR